MKDIKGLNEEELRSTLAGWGEQGSHARQILGWIYKKGVGDFGQMSDLSGTLRKKLAENFFLFSLELLEVLTSRDGTQKFLFQALDGSCVEGVLIPAGDRKTACVSTQAGCKFFCRFCASGALGYKRDLSCAEIMDELLYIKNNSKDKGLTHIVFMGTGEPLDNYENLLKAIRLINSHQGLHIGARRITISTSGLVPGIKRLAEEGLQLELSVSLHAPDDKTRSYLMPVNKKYPLESLIAACRDYVKKTDRQVTFEYILIRDLNSDLQNAKKLVTILQGLNCKVNLIPLNPVRGFKAEPPGKIETLFFRDYLLKHGINVTLRRPRGEDIDAACGQLRLKYEKA